jgi:phospholipase C
MPRFTALQKVASVGLLLLVPISSASAQFLQPEQSASKPVETTTPIKHLIVIYDENISFDHYFGTYPNATNPPGEPRFTALPGTPAPN